MVPLKRILLIEDDPDVRAVAGYAMEAVGGYRVRLCGDGRSALEEVDRFLPQFVLLDVMLPDIDGPALIPLLRRTRGGAAVPVVFLTARSDAAEQERYRRLGALDIIAKPFDPLSLPGRIDTIWRGAADVPAE